MEKNPLVEPLQGRRRSEAELVREQAVELLIDAQRIRMPAAAVQRDHLQLARALAERIRADRRLDKRQGLPVPAQCQLRDGELLDRVQPKILQPADGVPGELLEGKVRQRLTPPELQRLPEQRSSPLRIVRSVAASLRDEALEQQRVYRIGVGLDQVARCAGDDRPLSPDRLERLSKPGHIDLDRVRRGTGRVVGPDQLDQAVGRDDLAGVQEQDREQRALLWRPEIDNSPV